MVHLTFAKEAEMRPFVLVKWGPNLATRVFIFPSLLFFLITSENSNKSYYDRDNYRGQNALFEI